MEDKKKIVVICGPTASGKTGLAIDLCEKFNGEVISCGILGMILLFALQKRCGKIFGIS